MAWWWVAGSTTRVLSVVLAAAGAGAGAGAGAVCTGVVLPAAGLALCADAAIGKDKARRLKAVMAVTSLRMFELHLRAA